MSSSESLLIGRGKGAKCREQVKAVTKDKLFRFQDLEICKKAIEMLNRGLGTVFTLIDAPAVERYIDL